MTITIPFWAIVALMIVGTIGLLGWGASYRSQGMLDLGGGYQLLASLICILIMWLIFFIIV